MARNKNVRQSRNISRHIKTRKKLIQKTVNETVPKFEKWDRNIGYKENLQNFGFSTENVNKVVQDPILKDKKKIDQEITQPSLQVQEEVDLSMLKQGKVQIKSKLNLPEKVNYVVKPKSMNFEEQQCMVNLVKKYKKNLQKMFLDTKLNKFQWSLKQLEDMYEIYTQQNSN